MWAEKVDIMSHKIMEFENSQIHLGVTGSGETGVKSFIVKACVLYCCVLFAYVLFRGVREYMKSFGPCLGIIIFVLTPLFDSCFYLYAFVYHSVFFFRNLEYHIGTIIYLIYCLCYDLEQVEKYLLYLLSSLLSYSIPLKIATFCYDCVSYCIYVYYHPLDVVINLLYPIVNFCYLFVLGARMCIFEPREAWRLLGNRIGDWRYGHVSPPPVLRRQGVAPISAHLRARINQQQAFDTFLRARWENIHEDDDSLRNLEVLWQNVVDAAEAVWITAEEVPEPLVEFPPDYVRPISLPIAGTFKYKARDRAKIDYDFCRSDVHVIVYDDRSYGNYKDFRYFQMIRGKTVVITQEGQMFTFAYPILGIYDKEIKSWLCRRIKCRADYEKYKNITAENKRELFCLMNNKFGSVAFISNEYLQWSEYFHAIVTGPIVEEVVKHYTFLLLPICELAMRIHLYGFSNKSVILFMCPFLMHCLTLSLFSNIIYAMIFHSLYNLFVIHFFDNFANDMCGMIHYVWYKPKGSWKPVCSNIECDIAEGTRTFFNPLTPEELEIYPNRPFTVYKKLESVEEPKTILEIKSSSDTYAGQVVSDILNGTSIQLQFNLKEEGTENPKLKLDNSLLSNVLESEFVVDFAKIYLISKQIINLRFDEVLASLVANKWLIPFYNLLFDQNIDSIGDKAVSDFKDLMKLFINKTSMNITMTGANDPTSDTGGKIINKLMELLPAPIGTSPTTRAITGLVTTLIGCFFFRDFSVFKRCITGCAFPFSAMKEETIIDGIFAILEGCYRVYESRDFNDFFKPPKLVALKKEFTDYLMREFHTVAELTEGVQLGNTLIEKANSWTDPFIGRQCEQAMKKVVSLKALLDISTDRSPPMLIFSIGSPGTGKTVGWKNLLRMYESSVGHQIDPKLIAHIDLMVKYPAEKCNHKAKVLVINEMKADWSEDLKNDLIPTDVQLQRFMDSAPLQFKAAAVEGKGLVFADVEVIFIMANPFNYAASSETIKLKRRFEEHAIVVNQELVVFDGERPQIIQYNTADPRCTDINSLIHFRLLRCHCDGNLINFRSDSSVEWISTPRFLMYFHDRLKTHKERERISRMNLNRTCTCGVGVAAHLDGPSKRFIHLTPHCTEIETIDNVKQEIMCDCGVNNSLHRSEYDGIHWSDSPWKRRAVTGLFYTGTNLELNDEIIVELPLIHPNESIEERFERKAKAEDMFQKISPRLNLVWKTMDGEIIYTSMSFDDEKSFYLASLAFCLMFLYFLKERCYPMYKRLVEFLDLVDVMKGQIFTTLNHTNRLLTDVENDKNYFLKGVKKFGIPLGCIALGGATIGIVAGLIAKYVNASTTVLTAKPAIVRENLDSSTMSFDSITLVKNYSPELASKWSKASFDVPKVTMMKNHVQTDHLNPRLKNNLFFFAIHYTPTDLLNGEIRKANAGHVLKISSQFFLINRHYYEGCTLPVMVHLYHGVDDKSPSAGSFIFHPNQAKVVMHEGLETEVALINPPTKCEGRNLLSYFADEIPFNQCLGYVYKNQENYKQTNFEIFRTQQSQLSHVMRHKDPGLNGECGFPMILTLNSSTIIGGVVSCRQESYGTNYQMGCVLYRKDLVDCMESFKIPIVNSITFTAINHGPLAPNSKFNEISKINFLPFGTTGEATNTFNSNHKKTMFYEETYPRSSKKFAIPRQTDFVDQNGKFQCAFYQTFKTLPEGEIYQDHLLDSALDAFVSYIKIRVKEKYGDIKLSPLTLEESFLGDADQSIDRVNFKSSLGSEKLKNLKTRADLFTYEDGIYKFDEIWKQGFQKFHNEVLKGNLNAVLVEGNYKDEIRTEEKLEEAKIRIFYTVHIYWNTLARMYLGPLRAFLLRIPEISKCFGQIDSSSEQWDQFSKYLKFGDSDFMKLDMDFANFDITHRVMLIKTALFFYKLAKIFYGNEDAASMVYYIVYILLIQVYKQNGDLALKFAGLPSGHDGTLIINSIINIILMIYAFIILTRKDPMEFFDLVFPAAVGDDNLSAVDISIADVYNVATIAPIYSLFSYNVTNGDKSKEIKPFIHESDAVFLKRKFRFEPKLNKVVAPIDENSIWKMLSFWEDKGKEGISESARMAQCVDVALREFFFHGEVKFNQEREFLEKLCTKHKLICEIHTFESLVVKYNNKEFKMNWI